MANKLNVLGIGPFTSVSGYGAHCKEIVEGIEQFDFINPMVNLLPWGQCGWLSEGEYNERMIRHLNNYHAWEQSPIPKPNMDLVYHISVPTEFQRRFNCPYVGITAGIEADRVHGQWIININNNLDAMVVPSKFIKDVFLNTAVNIQDSMTGQVTQQKVNRPVYVIPESVDTDIFNDKTECKLDLNFDTEFNFLSVLQWGSGGVGEERKNTSLMIKWFKEAFKGDKKVGLVLKMNNINNSLIDRQNVLNRVNHLKAMFNLSDFPRVYIIHDHLSDSEMSQLYHHPKVKAYISMGSEGWGRPICEAAASNLPILTPPWSGLMEFMGMGSFVKLDYDMVDVPKCHVGNLFVEGSKWSRCREEDVKRKMRKIVDNYTTPKEWAVDLGEKIRVNFNRAVVNEIWRRFWLETGLIVKPEGNKLEEVVEID